MSAFQPFEPALGKTQVCVPSSTAQNFQFTGQGWNSMLITYQGAGNQVGPAYVRISVEVSLTTTVGILGVISNADLPLLGTGTAGALAPSVRLFATPQAGTFNVAVYCTVAPSVAGALYLTPGQGGDV